MGIEEGIIKIRNGIECLTIIGQIEGHTLLSGQTKTTKYEHVIPEIVRFEEDENAKGLLVVLNTAGGDIEAGLAIAELISGLSKPTVSIILGGGHSIGVPLAVSADYSFIVPSATMTLHPVRTSGVVIGAPQVFQYLNKLQQSIYDFITNHSNADIKTLKKLIFDTDEIANDVGTVLFGKETVDYGIIDSTGTISDAINKLKELIKQ